MKEYMIISILFIIGIICGIIFINNVNEEQYNEIELYVNNSIESLKSEENINVLNNLLFSLKNNIILAFLLWIFGMLLIGSVFLYLIVTLKGFLLGYTISTFISVLGIGKGILASLCSLFLQNIILIPCLFTIAVSSKTLHKAIINGRDREIIKVQLIKHTLILGIMLVFIILSSFIEIYISRQLFTFSIN